jgi:hypothetical protein
LLDRQGCVSESQDVIENKFAMIEMQMQDMFFTSGDDDSIVIVNDLVAIAKYMLQNWSKAQSQQKELFNKATNDKLLQERKRID